MTETVEIRREDMELGAAGRARWAIGLAAALALILPTLAYAGIYEDICASAVESLMSMVTDTIASINLGIIPQSFGMIFGSTSANISARDALYTLSHGAWRQVALPIASAVLTLATLIQLIRVAERADGNATLPGIRDVLKLFVFLWVYVWLIRNSWNLMLELFDMIAEIWKGMTPSSLAEVPPYELPAEATPGIDWVLAAMLAWGSAQVALVLSWVICFARGIQIYFMAMVSPIPIAFLSADETRQMGVGYLRSFAGLALGYAALAFVLAVYPMVFDVMLSAASGGAFYALRVTAACVLLCWLVWESGSWGLGVFGG